MSSVQPNQQDDKKQNEANLKVEDHITQIYDLIEVKGKGAYGIVWKARNKTTNDIVALKKIFDAFHNSTDAKRTFREVIFLEQLSQHENIIKLQQVIRAKNDKDLYMVFDYMETDLHKVIRANILETVHKQYVIYQLLKALKYLHSGGLIHRDLKPANLLVNAECQVKLADFGLARTVESSEDDGVPVLTEYVATRWYRAPEILLGSQRYSKAVDMWSIGCILGEIVINKAIFPGTSTMNQVELIVNLLGKPTESDIESIQAPLAAHVLQNIPNCAKKNLKSQFPGISEDTLDFIRKLLVFNPNQRMTVDQALAHPYMKDFQGTEDEIVLPQLIYTIMDDSVKYSVEQYRSMLYSHIKSKHSEKTVQQSRSPYLSAKKVQDQFSSIQNSASKATKQQPVMAQDNSRKPQSSNYQRSPPQSAFKVEKSPPPIGLKGDSEPSTTNSDKYKKDLVMKQVAKQPPNISMYIKGKNQTEYFSEQYKSIQEMIKRQKDGLQAGQKKDSKVFIESQDTVKKLVQNNYFHEGEVSNSSSIKQSFQTNKSVAQLKNNLSSDSFNVNKLQKKNSQDKLQTDSLLSQPVQPIKPRQSTGIQQRVPQVTLSGSLYQLGGRAQLYHGQPQQQQQPQPIKQNKTALDKNQLVGGNNPTSAKHLKSNSFMTNKKVNYFSTNQMKK